MNNQWIRNVARALKLAAAGVLVAACVTINVYFPAAAAEKAADQIIDSITGAVPAANGADSGKAPPTGHLGAARPNLLVAAVGKALYALVPAAHAGEANLDISSPEIRAITSAMQARFGQLQKYFDAGAVGMTNSGLIEVRDASGVPLPERAALTRLVADDNRDREALYVAIANANDHPEWSADIRRTFAARWVERGARPGWYYQNPGGAWVRK